MLAQVTHDDAPTPEARPPQDEDKQDMKDDELPAYFNRCIAL